MVGEIWVIARINLFCLPDEYYLADHTTLTRYFTNIPEYLLRHRQSVNHAYLIDAKVVMCHGDRVT